MGNPFISSQMSSQKAHFVLKDHSDICTFLSACTPVHIIGQNKEQNYIKKGQWPMFYYREMCRFSFITGNMITAKNISDLRAK